MKSSNTNTAKGLNCVLPNPRSILLIGLLVGSQMYNHMASEAMYAQKVDVDPACVARYGSVFPFCMSGSSPAAIGNLQLGSVQKAEYGESHEELEQLLEVS